MNNNDKILISLTAGIAIGAVMGILLTREKDHECKSNAQSKKIVTDLLKGLSKKSSKSANLKQDIEGAVEEVFAENHEEYLRKS